MLWGRLQRIGVIAAASLSESKHESLVREPISGDVLGASALDEDLNAEVTQSRGGQTRGNVAAIHVAAVTQARDPGPGRDHYRRKLAEHKTPKEARRSLKRRISNAIYRRILADQQRLHFQAA